jgi:hypothetical protein
MGEKSAEGRVRRTRGPASGQAREYTIRLGGKCHFTFVSASNAMSSRFDRAAASDDAGEKSAAKAATSPAAGTDRHACADVAESRSVKEAKPRVPSEHEKLPPGIGAMPENRAAFAEAVFARVDLVAAWTRLVNCEDAKIVQRALEKLDEMKYEGSSARNDEQYENEVLPRQRDPARN